MGFGFCMRIKYIVDHNVSFPVFFKYWGKRCYNAIPSIALKPLDSRIKFIFVVGCGHSGTTLMAAKLSNHPSIMGIGRETGVLIPGTHSWLGIKGIANEWSYFAGANGFEFVLEKTPKHIYSYKCVQKIFPYNKFIVMIRNPLDTISSLYDRFGDLRFSIERWVIDNKEALRLKGKDNVMLVKYEDFTTDPKGVLRNLCDFIGVTYENNMLESSGSVYDMIDQTKNMALRQKQVKEKVRPNIDRWRKNLSENQAKLIMAEVGDLANSLGYYGEYLKLSKTE